jgi:hypothetical protein
MMNADDVTSGRPPLLRPDGQWDHVALAAWFQDDACWKATMPDDEFSFLGPRAGDLIITDDSVEPYIGGLMLLLDEALMPAGLGLVDRDYRGRLCVEAGNELVPVEDEDSAFGPQLMVVGYLHLEPGDWPTLKDLFRAQTLPLEMLPRAPGHLAIAPRDIPF